MADVPRGVPGLFFYDLTGAAKGSVKRKRGDEEEEESGRDAKIARTGSADSSHHRTTFVFPGRIFIRGGSRTMTDLSNRVAKGSVDFVSTPADVRLGFFADGSFADASTPAGLGIVFRRFRPGASPENTKRVEVGYQISPIGYLDNVLVEGLAILQAIEVATAELEAIGPAAALQTTKVSVRIFSDSRTLLNGLDVGVLPQECDTHHVCLRELQFAIVAAGNRLHSKAAELGFTSSLQLHWVKAHSGTISYHTLADRMANDARTMPRSKICWVERVERVGRVACTPPVYTELLDEMDEISSNTMTKRQLENGGKSFTLASRPRQSLEDLYGNELPFSKLR